MTSSTTLPLQRLDLRSTHVRYLGRNFSVTQILTERIRKPYSARNHYRYQVQYCALQCDKSPSTCVGK